MIEASCELVDPRVRRTRRLLQQSLSSLLVSKEFEKISVQDIAEAATVNRATFYDHYDDKFALLESTISEQFSELLAQRGIQFERTCLSTLRTVVLGVCEYLAAAPGMDCKRQRQMEPHVESAVILVVRQLFLEGLRKYPSESRISPEMIATTLSWAIYGAAKEWIHTPDRCSAEEIVETAVKLIAPMLAEA